MGHKELLAREQLPEHHGVLLAARDEYGAISAAKCQRVHTVRVPMHPIHQDPFLPLGAATPKHNVAHHIAQREQRIPWVESSGAQLSARE